MRSSRLRPHTLPAARAHTDTQGSSLFGSDEEHQASSTQTLLYITFSLLHLVSSFLQACSIVLPFLTIFRLSRQAQTSAMMNVLNNLFSILGGVEGGSQFRTIGLTRETVSPWLSRGNGAEMDSCYKRRGGGNW